jgi:hypothetical protein
MAMAACEGAAMRRRLPLLAAVVCASALAAPAFADDVIQTGAEGPPPAAEAPPPALRLQTSPPSNRDQAIGDWARGVIAGEPANSAAPQARAGCTPPPDRKPHGEVWAGVGTSGYRELGGVVTQPIGDCGQVTVAIDHAAGDWAASNWAASNRNGR